MRLFVLGKPTYDDLPNGTRPGWERLPCVGGWAWEEGAWGGLSRCEFAWFSWFCLRFLVVFFFFLLHVFLQGFIVFFLRFLVLCFSGDFFRLGPY